MLYDLLLLILASFRALLAPQEEMPPPPPPAPTYLYSRIGGTDVPMLHCEEDEVIGFDSTQPAPYPINCIHIDDLISLRG